VRVVLGRIALLLGVAVVAAMAWYGATALFDMGKSDDEGDDTSEQRACDAATKRQARAAERAFMKEYGRARWFSDVVVSRTDRVESPTPPIDGDGAVLLVTHARRAKLPELPDCIEDVPIVYVVGRTFVVD
jgi:hypothetical protein